MRWNRLAAAGVLLSLASHSVWGAVGGPFDPERGALLLQGAADGSDLPAPSLGTEVVIRITGIVARTQITQTFLNPTDEWLTGVYLFPLPGDAAVDTLRLAVGSRHSTSVALESEEAKSALEAATLGGRRASLLEQVRPGLYAISVANIGPGETVKVEIEMQQVVSWELGHFTLRFPMLAPPGYVVPGCPGLDEPPLSEQEAAERPAVPFMLFVDLAPGFPLSRIDSPTHWLHIETRIGSLRWAVSLAHGIEPADGDFVLQWTPAVGREPRAVYFAEEVEGESYALLMMIPQDGLFPRLDEPLLRDVEAQWSDPRAELWPARLPDLSPGEPLVVTARLDEAGAVTVSGLRNGSSWQDELPAPGVVQEAGLDKLWAGLKVQGLLDRLQEGADGDEVREEVTALGLRYHLVTPYTSLVVVDSEEAAPAGVTPEIRRISRAGVTQAELDKVPVSHDPWTVLQATPQVLTDRVNVTGNESVQQPAAATTDPGISEIDSLLITDLSSAWAAWAAGLPDLSPEGLHVVKLTGELKRTAESLQQRYESKHRHPSRTEARAIAALSELNDGAEKLLHRQGADGDRRRSLEELYRAVDRADESLRPLWRRRSIARDLERIRTLLAELDRSFGGGDSGLDSGLCG